MLTAAGEIRHCNSHSIHFTSLTGLVAFTIFGFYVISIFNRLFMFYVLAFTDISIRFNRDTPMLIKPVCNRRTTDYKYLPTVVLMTMMYSKPRETKRHTR